MGFSLYGDLAYGVRLSVIDVVRSYGDARTNPSSVIDEFGISVRDASEILWLLRLTRGAGCSQVDRLFSTRVDERVAAERAEREVDTMAHTRLTALHLALQELESHARACGLEFRAELESDQHDDGRITIVLTRPIDSGLIYDMRGGVGELPLPSDDLRARLLSFCERVPFDVRPAALLTWSLN